MPFVLLSYIIPAVSKCNTITPSLLRKPEMLTQTQHRHTHKAEFIAKKKRSQRVRTPLSGGARPLQSKPFHSGGLGISSINRAAGLLSSLLLELILAQWPERLPFYIWSMSNSQMARRPEVSCLIVQILVNWANGRLGAAVENGKVEKGKIRALHKRSRSILFP